jgi:hypothetical protein
LPTFGERIREMINECRPHLEHLEGRDEIEGVIVGVWSPLNKPLLKYSMSMFCEFIWYPVGNSSKSLDSIGD